MTNPKILKYLKDQERRVRIVRARAEEQLRAIYLLQDLVRGITELSDRGAAAPNKLLDEHVASYKKVYGK